MIDVVCQNCGQAGSVQDGAAGRIVKCRRCGAGVVVGDDFGSLSSAITVSQRPPQSSMIAWLSITAIAAIVIVVGVGVWRSVRPVTPHEALTDYLECWQLGRQPDIRLVATVDDPMRAFVLVGFKIGPAIQLKSGATDFQVTLTMVSLAKTQLVNPRIYRVSDINEAGLAISSRAP